MIFQRRNAQPEPAPVTTSEGTYELIWDEARRLLVRQEADLDALRTRALSLLAAGGVIAGLFAGKVGHPAPSRTFGYVALGALVVSALLVLFIHWPRSWDFAHDLGDWIAAFDTGVVIKYDDVAVVLAAGFEGCRRANQKKIAWLYRALTGICGLLGLQVAAWELASLLG